VGRCGRVARHRAARRNRVAASRHSDGVVLDARSRGRHCSHRIERLGSVVVHGMDRAGRMLR